MSAKKPRHCYRCKRDFPTTTLYKSHLLDGCCQGRTRGTHISCSSCDAGLAGLAGAASKFIEKQLAQGWQA